MSQAQSTPLLLPQDPTPTPIVYDKHKIPHKKHKAQILVIIYHPFAALPSIGAIISSVIWR